MDTIAVGSDIRRTLVIIDDELGKVSPPLHPIVRKEVARAMWRAINREIQDRLKQGWAPPRQTI